MRERSARLSYSVVRGRARSMFFLVKMEEKLKI